MNVLELCRLLLLVSVNLQRKIWNHVKNVRLIKEKTIKKIDIDGEQDEKFSGRLVLCSYPSLSSISIKNCSYWINSLIIFNNDNLTSITIDNAFNNAIKVEIKSI